MTDLKHLSWDNFRATVLVAGQQRVHRVTNSPQIELFGDGIANRIGIQLEADSDALIPAVLSRLSFISAQTVVRGGRTFLEVSTSSVPLRRQFYHFAMAVAERVVVDKLPAVEAVEVELRCFTDLLEETAVMGLEKQIGLLGELVFLERLMVRGGLAALDSWHTPSPEPHDFRINQLEFEVKTTLSARRIHTIHGTEQLIPSKGCSLWLISVLLGPPGSGVGFSLSDKVAELETRLASSTAHTQRFATALESRGLHQSDRIQYSRQYTLRRPIGAVPVSDSFPAITRRTIQEALGPLAVRVESLDYDVNVEGLEVEDGTPAFEAALPK